jgi:hypothetical protein
MKIIKKYLHDYKNTNFDPFIYFKNTNGIGDLIACILHSKFLGFFTYVFTGKIEPCLKCQKRRNAFNILLPLPIWKLFYKNFEEYSEGIKHYTNKNFKDEINNKDYIESILKKIQENQKNIEIFKNEKKIFQPEDDNFFENYLLITQFNNQHEDFYITTKIYKKYNNEQ